MIEPEVTIYPNYLSQQTANDLYIQLRDEIEWDERMKARKTACFGQSYDDSGINYEIQPMQYLLVPLCMLIETSLGFYPTNCLINYYEDGQSRMGFHSDATYNLDADTGVIILSLGSERKLSFRAKIDHTLRFNYLLPSGSLLYMTQGTQDFWEHAVKPTKTSEGRISLTFRRIISNSVNHSHVPSS
jgi:alkylated DNA repair dioxygenase AlkB